MKSQGFSKKSLYIVNDQSSILNLQSPVSNHMKAPVQKLPDTGFHIEAPIKRVPYRGSHGIEFNETNTIPLEILTSLQKRPYIVFGPNKPLQRITNGVKGIEFAMFYYVV